MPPLVRALQDAVGERDAVAVHVGATSQDVLDTALMLLARDAVAAIDADLAAAAAAAAGLAERHRDDVVMGRTLMQQALPTTFGLKAAGWLSGLDGARLRLAEVVASLPVQYGGAVGTLAASRGSGVALRAALAAELGLAPTRPSPWHTVRLPIADLAGALGAAAGVVATVAVDVVLMAQTEVAEVAEVSETRGGSSAMPHKNNPVAAISARACARRAPGLVGDAVRGDGAGARAGRRRLAQRVADADRPAGHRRLGGVLAGREPRLPPAGPRPDGGDGRGRGPGGSSPAAIAEALTPSLGAGAAHDAAADAVQQARETGRPLADVLAGRPGIDVAALTAATAPDVGEAGAQVDAVLADHRRLTEGTA